MMDFCVCASPVRAPTPEQDSPYPLNKTQKIRVGRDRMINSVHRALWTDGLAIFHTANERMFPVKQYIS